MIVWLNGTHGAGKTTTSALVQQLIPDSRVFDAEKVGETLMDITPGLPATDNFQHWPPWRQLVVETARRVLGYTGGTVVMPMTVVLHADQDPLRMRNHPPHACPGRPTKSQQPSRVEVRPRFGRPVLEATPQLATVVGVWTGAGVSSGACRRTPRTSR
jgi:hypothetical protein